MAAKDREGFQEFPQASFTVPPREQMEELSAMTQNLLEGQQGVGEAVEGDPYATAVRYLEKHRIVEILQVTIETNLQIHCERSLIIAALDRYIMHRNTMGSRSQDTLAVPPTMIHQFCRVMCMKNTDV